MNVYLILLCIIIIVYFFIQKKSCHGEKPHAANLTDQAGNLLETKDPSSHHTHDLYVGETVHNLPDPHRPPSGSTVVRSDRRSHPPHDFTVEETLHKIPDFNSQSSSKKTPPEPSVESVDEPQIDLTQNYTVYTIPAKTSALPQLWTVKLSPFWVTGSFVATTSLFAMKTIPPNRGFYVQKSIGDDNQLHQGDAIVFGAKYASYDDQTEVRFGPESAVATNKQPTFVENNVSFWMSLQHTWVRSQYVFCLIHDIAASLEESHLRSQTEFFTKIDLLISHALQLEHFAVSTTDCKYTLNISDPMFLNPEHFEVFLEQVLTEPVITKVYFYILASGTSALPALRSEAEFLFDKYAGPTELTPAHTKRHLELLYSDILAASPMHLVISKIKLLKQFEQYDKFPTLKDFEALNILEGVDVEGLTENQIIPLSKYPFAL
ncbi:hypothetical protein HDE_06206 [Halotydeus destructor]|nr:hypothetical protein HDE_06206 [Halotydeus destructor]